MKPARILFSLVLISLTSACARQVAFNQAYLPDEEIALVSDASAILVIPEEEERFVHKGAPSSFQGWATSLTIPLGYILKAVSEEVLGDRFSGGVAFANEGVASSPSAIVFSPRIQRFEYWYNALTNGGVAITPQVEIDLQVRISDGAGNEFFDSVLESGRVSSDTYVFSTRGAEMINQTVHRVLYDLLERSLEDARPRIAARH